MNLLFNIEEQAVPDINGLHYNPDFITADEESALLSKIDAQPWMNDLKRRVQHYGYRYDYKARHVNDNAFLGELPDWLQTLAQRLQNNGTFKNKPDQAIINEYLPGQGISPHVDCVPCFGENIASLSLGSDTTMQFTQPKTRHKEELHLRQRSIVTLSHDARYKWQHSIPARKSDVINGFKFVRDRRVSITFRNVITT